MARPAMTQGTRRRDYQTLESAHFVVYFDAALADVARRVAIVAERAHTTLAPALDHEPADKTLIVVSDDTDAANGYALVLPRNAIGVYATGPSGFNELDDHDDWLYGLLAHEYTHVLHLDTIEGLPRVVNRVLGKTWSPSQIMPRWLIEGLATYEESKRSAGGRTRGARFDQVLRTAVQGDVALRLDEVSGAPRGFPHGDTVYVYGSQFLRYLFDRFGDDTARKMSHASAGYAPPFAVNRQIAKVVGRSFPELYADWQRHLRDRYALQSQAVERRGVVEGRALTRTGEANVWPHYTRDGKELVWQQSDGYAIARVRALPVGGDATAARDVVRIDALGPFDVLADGSLIYEQGWTYRREYAFEDLARWDAATGRHDRLSVGRRARDPAASPDGRRVAFSMNEHAESVIAIADAAPGAPAQVVWRGARFDQAYQPAWAPDGRRLRVPRQYACVQRTRSRTQRPVSASGQSAASHSDTLRPRPRFCAHRPPGQARV